jgi:hypothetical protein
MQNAFSEKFYTFFAKRGLISKKYPINEPGDSWYSPNYRLILRSEKRPVANFQVDQDKVQQSD